jgi:hypothetical protein
MNFVGSHRWYHVGGATDRLAMKRRAYLYDIAFPSSSTSATNAVSFQDAGATTGLLDSRSWLSNSTNTSTFNLNLISAVGKPTAYGHTITAAFFGSYTTGGGVTYTWVKGADWP